MGNEVNAASWTASELLASVYRLSKLPTAGSIDYPPSEVLPMCDEAIHAYAGHLLSGARDGRLVHTTLRALDDDAVDYSGQLYTLPPMAVAGSIESIKWVDDDGDSESSLRVLPVGMGRIFASTTEASTPTSYELMADTIKIYPPPAARGSLRIAYMRRHGQLVIGSDTATLVSVETLSATQADLQLSSYPSSFVADAWVDVYGPNYPYPLKASYRSSGVGISTYLGVYGVYAEIAAELVAGDTVVIYGKTPYVSLPLEMKRGLAQQVARQITAELGDLQLSDGYDTLSKEDGQRVADMLSPRAKSDKVKLVNPYSLARGSAVRRWGGRWRA